MNKYDSPLKSNLLNHFLHNQQMILGNIGISTYDCEKWQSTLTLSDFDLLYMIKGHMHVQYDQKTVLLTQHNLVLLRPLHTYYFFDADAPVEIAYNHFDLALGYALESIMPPLFACNRHHVNTAFVEYDAYRKKTVPDRSYNPFYIRSCLMRLFHDLVKYMLLDTTDCEPASNLSDFSHLLMYIEQNLSEPLTVETLANKSNYSEKYLFQLFKKYVHTTPRAYVLEKKMRHAARLLVETKSCVTEISDAVGFSHASVFCKNFKRTFGLTPTAYRNKRRLIL